MTDSVASPVPMVGREREQHELQAALARTAASHGSLVVVSGPAGIGKTRLLRWVEEQGRAQRFDVRWAYCLKDSNQALFPFEQLFRSGAHPPEGGDVPASVPVGEQPTVQIFEEEKPTLFFQRIVPLSQVHPTMIITREREAPLRARYPNLGSGAQVLTLSRVDSPGSINPTSLDGLGERIERHLAAAPGSVVSISGLEYLISQNGFVAVLRLIQFLRDAADSTSGHLVVSLHPEALEKREVALLQAEGEVVVARSVPGEEAERRAETPAQSMLRYLRDLDHTSQRHPQLLFVDDLQWADAASLTAVQFLARNVQKLPVLLVASLRKGGEPTASLGDDSSLIEALDGMEREGTMTNVLVHALTETALAKLCAAVAGAPPVLGNEDGSLSPLLERTGGNPYFLLELVRQMLEEGLLKIRGGRAVFTPNFRGATATPLHLPDTLKRLVHRRLQMLSQEERQVLEMAAVAGSEFDETMVATALDAEKDGVARLLESMATRHSILDHLPGHVGRWSFGHPLVWEGTLAEIPEGRLREDAKRLALKVKRQQPGDVEAIARLEYLSRDPDEGPRWVREAIDQAVIAHGSQAVNTYHQWLQELLTVGGVDPKERLREGLELTLRLYCSGGSVGAMRGMFQSLENIPAEPDDRILFETYRCYFIFANAPDEGELALRTCLSGAHARGTKLTPLVEALAKAVEGAARFARGDFQGSIDCYREANRLAPEDTPNWLRIRFYYEQGWMAGELALEEEYRECLEKARLLVGGESVDRTSALLYNLAGEFALHRGNVREAGENATRAGEVARKMGNMAEYGGNLWNLARVHEMAGEFGKMQRCINEGRTLAERFGLTFMIAFFGLAQARCDLHERKLDEALQEITKALPNLTANSNAGPPGYAHLTLGHVHLLRGELEEAERALARIADDRKDLPPEDVSFYHQLRSELARRLGQREEARAQADQALAWARKLHARMEEARSLDVQANWEKTFGSSEEARKLFASADELYKSTGAVPLARL